MPSLALDSFPVRLAGLGALVAAGGALVTLVPTLSVGGVTVPTPPALALTASALLVPAVVSHHRAGEGRAALRWALWAVGVPLSLLAHPTLSALGVLAVLAALAVQFGADRRLRRVAA
jgi:hypothetical protein